MNGNCPVGAANKQAIEDLGKRVNGFDTKFETVFHKLDANRTWQMLVLGGICVNLAIMLLKTWNGQ